MDRALDHRIFFECWPVTWHVAPLDGDVPFTDHARPCASTIIHSTPQCIPVFSLSIMSNSVLVLGANGTVGSHLVKELVARGAAVKAASRKGTAPALPGVQGVVFDYADSSTFGPALANVDAIFALAPGSTEDAASTLKPIVAAAAERRIKVVLMTAFGVNASDEIPYRRLELYLEGSGTKFAILRPNWFTDNFLTYWGHGVRAGTISVPAGEGQSSFIDTRDIAAVAAVVLTSSTFDNTALDLTGPRALSYAESAELIAKAIGKPVKYAAASDEDFIATLIASGAPAGYSRLLASIFGPVRLGYTARVTDAVQRVTGRPARSVEAWVAENVAKLK
jgi:uncharacterized protein YbjT (DUF2867 family)